MAAEYSSDLIEGTTHLICNTVATKKYQVWPLIVLCFSNLQTAVEKRVPVVTFDWIEQSYTKREMLPVEDFALPPFSVITSLLNVFAEIFRIL